MARLFIAIPLPLEVRGRLHEVQPPAWPGTRLIGGNEFHLTLHFLGEVDALAAERLRAGCSGLTTPAFALRIRGIGTFPDRKRPRVLWAGIVPQPSLALLHEELGERLQGSIGFQPESRPYAPHVTLARFNAPPPSQELDRYIERHDAFELPEICVTHVVVYSSQFPEGRPHYVEEMRFDLPQPV